MEGMTMPMHEHEAAAREWLAICEGRLKDAQVEFDCAHLRLTAWKDEHAAARKELDAALADAALTAPEPTGGE